MTNIPASAAALKTLATPNVKTATDRIRQLSQTGLFMQTSVQRQPVFGRCVPVVHSGSEDHTVKLWDTQTGSLLQTLEGHRRLVSSVSFSPDGARLASGSQDDTVKLWDVQIGRPPNLEGHNRSLVSVAFSPNGTRLASAAGDKTIKLWDARTGGLFQSLESHRNWIFTLLDRFVSEGVYSVAFSPDSARLASGFYRTVKLWDVQTGRLVQRLETHRTHVRSVVFSPDGARLASGSDDGIVTLWDARSGRVLWSLGGTDPLPVRPVCDFERSLGRSRAANDAATVWSAGE